MGSILKIKDKSSFAKATKDENAKMRKRRSGEIATALDSRPRNDKKAKRAGTG